MKWSGVHTPIAAPAVPTPPAAPIPGALRARACCRARKASLPTEAAPPGCVSGITTSPLASTMSGVARSGTGTVRGAG